ncbi:MAG: hypothetical protein J5746_00295 [Victivallales bacterium]|nr:hypothetical protein [Victivallales bacterium]
MDAKFKKQADQFIREETQFHLGFLPTEQSNPKSRTLQADFKKSASKGVACLQRIDRDVLAMLRRVMVSKNYNKLVSQGLKTIRNGGRIIFSGCGATGRLSILLEAMWRKYCTENKAAAKYADAVESIMTGGDFALIRSVEFFEDYASFGKRQVEEAKMCDKDMLVAITEGGETSSVLGSLYEAADRGCAVFLLFNNPADVLAAHLERSRRAIEDKRVCVLDLHCGPMALAGSTRMQATTSEQYVAGAALETIMHKLMRLPELDYVQAFEDLLTSLEEPGNVRNMARYICFEARTYRNSGKMTYFADDFLLDIFTDTTERSPTFMLPPFKKCDDKVSPQPWTFVKNPLYSTSEAWAKALNRKHRCLDWTPEDYVAMGAGDKIAKRPPAISKDEMLKILIGNENVEERRGGPDDAAVLISVGAPSKELKRAFSQYAVDFAKKGFLHINQDAPGFGIEAKCAKGALSLLEHLALKLALNTISTGVMTMLGRVTGNWMSWVDCTNKKLLDRGTRLLVELGGVDYRTACETLFEAIDEVAKMKGTKPSPVQVALAKLR